MPATRNGRRPCDRFLRHSISLRPSRTRFTPEPGFELLFNGRDLTGWRYLATSPEEAATIKKSQAKIQPHRLDRSWKRKLLSMVKPRHGWEICRQERRLIVTTHPPKAEDSAALDGLREFGKDFVLKLEFVARDPEHADSGSSFAIRSCSVATIPWPVPTKNSNTTNPRNGMNGGRGSRRGRQVHV